MSCSKAQILLLLERIKEEMKDPRDREIIQRYINLVKYSAWKELMAELRA